MLTVELQLLFITKPAQSKLQANEPYDISYIFYHVHHHHHHTQCIPLIEKPRIESRERRTVATHTQKGERDQ